jgi:hypothetical protein
MFTAHEEGCSEFVPHAHGGIGQLECPCVAVQGLALSAAKPHRRLVRKVRENASEFVQVSSHSIGLFLFSVEKWWRAQVTRGC